MGEREIGLGMLELLHDARADVVAASFKHDATPPITTAVPNPHPANAATRPIPQSKPP